MRQYLILNWSYEVLIQKINNRINKKLETFIRYIQCHSINKHFHITTQGTKLSPHRIFINNRYSCACRAKRTGKWFGGALILSKCGYLYPLRVPTSVKQARLGRCLQLISCLPVCRCLTAVFVFRRCRTHVTSWPCFGYDDNRVNTVL